jgi:hypothetical protein
MKKIWLARSQNRLKGRMKWRIFIMKKEKTAKPKNTKRSTSTVVMYVAVSITAIITIASLVNNIILFLQNVAQYVAQGYPVAEVIKQLLPAQLLPGLFESLAVYGGIAFLIFTAGSINQKVSQCLTLLTITKEANNSCDTAEKSIMEENVGAEEEEEKEDI